MYLNMRLFFLWKKSIFAQNQIAYMFLKGLQYKSAKKALTKKLDNATAKEVSKTPIKTVGIIINADEMHNFDTVVKQLQIEANVHVLCYHKDFKKTRTVNYPVFYQKDFGWKGKPQGKDLKQFFDTSFDVLISYYNNNIVPLQLVSGLHKADFKIGIEGCDQKIHDLIIQTKKEEVQTFVEELHKYLHILNKL